MSKVQILPKDIKNSLSQYPLSDLEMLLNDIRLAIFEKKAQSKKGQELQLLQQLNECVLPEGHLAEFLKLREKRKVAELSKEESKRFFELIEEDHVLQIKRVKILKQLADLKKVSVPKLMEMLELKAPASV